MKITDGSAGATLAGSLVDSTQRSSAAGKLSGPGTAATKTGSLPGSTAARDAASLSGLGSLLAASSTEDIRADRVAALKAALNDGTYSVSAPDVADKILREMLR